jgi:hypothetical protein
MAPLQYTYQCIEKSSYIAARRAMTGDQCNLSEIVEYKPNEDGILKIPKKEKALENQGLILSIWRKV